MEMNYAHKISISGLAGRIGLDRSYFGQLFRDTTGLPPQQYLLQLRMAKACQLMRRSFLPIGTIAHSVGYDDPLLFSACFAASSANRQPTTAGSMKILQNSRLNAASPPGTERQPQLNEGGN